MTATKLMSLGEAIAEFVPDGSSVVIGAGLESCIPFAAGHEIIRQRKRHLTLVGPISDILFDQLIGAGCVAAVRAGAMGVPFLPTRTALGSDLFSTNPHLTAVTCPFTAERLAAVAAIVPDVTILHVQRADEAGRAHLWGNFGVAREAALASRWVILCAEEIVAAEVIERDPNRVILPGFRVSAVVHVPWGAHPSPVPGHYNRDHGMFLSYQRESKTPEAFAAWQASWVDGVRDRAEYLARLGQERTASLALKHHALSEAVDYGC